MAREKKEIEAAEYSYMDTYGDMVTLLLTFFVLLFAFSSLDQSKWNSIVQAFTGSMPKTKITAIQLLDEPNFSEYIPVIASQLTKSKEKVYELNTASGEMVEVKESEIVEKAVAMDQETLDVIASPEYIEIERQFRQLHDNLLNYIETAGLEDMLYASRDQDTITIQVTSGVLFSSGSATLLPDYLPMLDTLELMLADTLDSISFIQVEGHTDNVPIRYANFIDNRDLSSARANTVVRYIEAKGNVPRNMLLGVGHGEYAPIAPNDTEENRQQNRRVQFVLTKKALTIEDITHEEATP